MTRRGFASPWSTKVSYRNTLGHTAVFAVDGCDALERLDQHTFSLLLTDCQMPNLDGYDLTREIRRREAASGQPPLPIVAITASALAGEKENCEAAGMSGCIAKPVDMDELRATVAAHLPGSA